MSFFKRFSKKLKSDLAGGLNLLSTGFQKPLETARTLIFNPTKIPQLVKETTSQPVKKQVTKTLINTALASGTLLLRKPITKKLVTPKGIIGTTALAGGLAVSPKLTKFVEPSGLIEKAHKGGKIVGDVIEGKTPQVSKSFKEGGLIGGLGATAGAVAGLTAGAVVTKKVINKVKKEKELAPPILSSPIPTSPSVASEIRKQQTPTIPMEKKQPTITIKPQNKNYINIINQSI